MSNGAISEVAGRIRTVRQRLDEMVEGALPPVIDGEATEPIDEAKVDDLFIDLSGEIIDGHIESLADRLGVDRTNAIFSLYREGVFSQRDIRHFADMDHWDVEGYLDDHPEFKR